MKVRRVYNLQPILGTGFNTYEAEATYDDPKGDQTVIISYLNYLVEEMFYTYVLSLTDAQTEEALEQFKNIKSNRIKFQKQLLGE